VRKVFIVILLPTCLGIFACQSSAPKISKDVVLNSKANRIPADDSGLQSKILIEIKDALFPIRSIEQLRQPNGRIAKKYGHASEAYQRAAIKRWGPITESFMPPVLQLMTFARTSENDSVVADLLFGLSFWGEPTGKPIQMISTVSINEPVYYPHNHYYNHGLSKIWAQAASQLHDIGFNPDWANAKVLSLTDTEIIIQHRKDLNAILGEDFRNFTVLADRFGGIDSPPMESKSPNWAEIYRRSEGSTRPDNFRSFSIVISYPLKNFSFDPDGPIRIAYVGNPVKGSYGNQRYYSFSRLYLLEECSDWLKSYTDFDYFDPSWINKFPNKNPYCVENRLGPDNRPFDWIDFYPASRLERHVANVQLGPKPPPEDMSFCAVLKRKLKFTMSSIDGVYGAIRDRRFQLSRGPVDPKFRGTSEKFAQSELDNFMKEYGTKAKECEPTFGKMLLEIRETIRDIRQLDSL
jgi:hypothetical protein